MTPAGGWQFAAGRFAGGDRDELVGYHPSNGTIWVGTNTGAGFEFAQWATVTPAAGWRLYAGRFTGGEVDDILVHHPSNGTLTVGRNTGGGFTFEEWATVSPPGGWTFTVGHFRSGPVADVVGYHPTSGTVWLGANTGGAFALEPWGTVAPPGGWAITAADVTGNGRTDVLAYHPSNGSLWVGRNTGGGLETEPWYTFSPLANVNTWLYNGWGGYSKYSGRATLSFLRPCPGASPVGWGFEALHLTRAELWILGWPTGEGYRPDVYSDIDWHNGIDLSTYRCLVIGTHPEYWTTTMYDRLQGYLESGGSLLYLGGNGIFENGEYATDQTQMVFWAGVDRTGVRTDAMFRRLSPPRSERSLLGVTTERCGAIGTPYVVVEPDPPMFRWTGLAGSKTFGNTGLNTGADNGKASGWEVDTVDGPGARTVPVDCAMDSPPTPDSPLPEGLQIIATEVPEAAGRGADMVFYRHPGGGIVLSAGSLTFGGNMPVDPAIQQILRNALADAGVG